MGPHSVVSYPWPLPSRFHKLPARVCVCVGAGGGCLCPATCEILPFSAFRLWPWPAVCCPVPRKDEALKGGAVEREQHPRVPNLLNIVSRRCLYKAAWLLRAEVGGRVGVGSQAGVASRQHPLQVGSHGSGKAQLPYQGGGWDGHVFVGTHPLSAALLTMNDPTSWPSVASAFIARQGPVLSEPGRLVSGLGCCSDPA